MTDEGGSDTDEAEEVLGLAFVAAVQAATSCQPGHCPAPRPSDADPVVAKTRFHQTLDKACHALTNESDQLASLGRNGALKDLASYGGLRCLL